MRKSGLTSGTLQHLNRLARKSSLNHRFGSWEDESEGASIEEGLDPASDDALFLEFEDQVEFDLSSESTEPVTEDSADDYESGVEEYSFEKEDTDAAFNAEPEPWNDAWEITRARRKGYDIRNYYLEGGSGPLAGPVSIRVGVLLESWLNIDDADLNYMETHIRDYLKASLKMSNEHQLQVMVEANTPDAEETRHGADVFVEFDGVEPTDSEELRALLEGLVMNAVFEYGQADE